jgi:hypothetical protein
VEHPVAQDACVVDEHVELPEGIERRRQNGLRGFDRADGRVVRDRGDSQLGDLLGDRIGCVRIDIVDDDAAPLTSEGKSDGPADPTTRAGDDACLAFEASHRGAS